MVGGSVWWWWWQWLYSSSVGGIVVAWVVAGFNGISAWMWLRLASSRSYLLSDVSENPWDGIRGQATVSSSRSPHPTGAHKRKAGGTNRDRQEETTFFFLLPYFDELIFVPIKWLSYKWKLLRFSPDYLPVPAETAVIHQHDKFSSAS